MNILFYYPSNLRSNVLESQMIYLKQQGHRVFLLTISDPGPLHEYLTPFGIETASQQIKTTNRFFFYRKSIRHLQHFCTDKKIALVYCHLQQANFIGVLAQKKLTETRFITCRHHHDRVQKGESRTARFFDRVINKRAKTIIVPSRMVYEQVTVAEKVSPDRVALIPYTYDFGLFPLPDSNQSEKIRHSFSHELVAVTLTRLVPGKGLSESIDVVHQLRLKGIDVGLIIAGDGELRPQLEEKIKAYGLEKHIWLTGFVSNTMDYIAASDFMLLLTDNEASNNAVKEAAFCSKTAVTCSGVGDFDDYIIQGENGFLVNPQNKTAEAVTAIEEISRNKTLLPNMGEKIKQAVLDRFSIEKIILTYSKFHH